MALLEEYEKRTAWKYEPICGIFHTPESLQAKVRPDGGYAHFPGTTTAFRLEGRTADVIGRMQDELHRSLSGTDMLAAPLEKDQLHMTLHDLISPEKTVYGVGNWAQYLDEIDDSISRANEEIRKIREVFCGRKIRMQADRIVNMVSKSLVLMLKPLTEEDFALLTELYGRFDGIVSLPYPLTPHVTLAYFRPCMLDGNALQRAVEAVQVDAQNAPVFEFAVEDLKVQRFENMTLFVDA